MHTMFLLNVLWCLRINFKLRISRSIKFVSLTNFLRSEQIFPVKVVGVQKSKRRKSFGVCPSFGYANTAYAPDGLPCFQVCSISRYACRRYAKIHSAEATVEEEEEFSILSTGEKH